MSCDYCFVVRNLLPGQTFTERGQTYPSVTFFSNPFDSPFTFGPHQVSPNHVHVPISTQVMSMFSGPDGDFLVNSDKNFVVLSPIKGQLTFQEVLFPSSQTHEIVVLSSNMHRSVYAGCVIVGMESDRPHSKLACFVFFMNGPEKTVPTNGPETIVPKLDLIDHSPDVVAHFRKMEREIMKKIGTPWEPVTFTRTVTVRAEKFKGVMSHLSTTLIAKQKAAIALLVPPNKEPKRAATEDETASKKAKTKDN